MAEGPGVSTQSLIAGLRTVFSRQIVSGGLEYFDYQVRVASQVVIPWLQTRITVGGARVADFGTHEGGTLEALRAAGAKSAVGYELNEHVVGTSRFVPDDAFRVEIADLTKLEGVDRSFDIIILHDVLEHVIDCGAVLTAARRCLAGEGRIFVSFPPYWGPYGGHQHLAQSIARFTPYVHYLPERIFLRFASPGDNEYMTRLDSLDDMTSVRRTKLSLRRAEAEFAHAGLAVTDAEFFVLRPEYKVRYGLPTIGAGTVGRRGLLREFVVSGAFYLLSAPV